MRIGLIAAMQVELKTILEGLGGGEEERVFGRSIYRARCGQHELYMGVSGIGKVNAAGFSQLLLDRYQVESIWNSGIAGSLRRTLKPLDIVVGSRLYYHDFPLHILRGTYPYMDSFPTARQLRKLAVDSVPEGHRVEEGIVVSGDDFIDSKEKKDRILSLYPALACDMESAAVAHVAAGADVSCLILRCISDNADEDMSGTYENFEKAAAELSAEIVLRMLRKL